MNENSLVVTGEIFESVADTDGLCWRVSLIQEGESKNRTFYSGEVLKKAMPLFDGAPCFADHKDGEKSVRDIVGWFSDPVYENIDSKGNIVATFNILASEKWFRDKVSEAWERGKKDLIGFSILGNGEKRLAKAQDGHIFQEVLAIENLISIDAVARPSAGGRFLQPLQEDIAMKLEDMTREELLALRPELFEELVDLAKLSKEEIKKLRPDLFDDDEDEGDDENKEPVEKAAPAKSETVDDKDAPDPVMDEVAKLKKALDDLAAEREADRKEKAVAEAIAESGLPKAFQDKLRKQFANGLLGEDKLQEAIVAEREALEAVNPPNLPDLWSSRITVRETEMDKINKAMDGMFEGRDVDKVPRFQNLRHAYSVITGTPIFDVKPQMILRESAEGFDSSLLRENVTSSTWSNILGTSINRQMLKEYRSEQYNDWRKIASVERLSDMKRQDRLQLGGYGELSTVSEGEDYSSLTTPNEQLQTYTPAVKGGIETITFQAIANDDMNQIRRVPKSLGRAAKVTLYRNVMSVLTTNAAMDYDSVALFHSSHNNLGSSALSDSALTAAIQAMKAQTVPVGTAATAIEYLDNTPKTLVVPSDLWRTAWDLVMNEVLVLDSGFNATQKNPFYGKFEIVEVRHWSDTNNWYLIADPAETPTIEVGFYGSEEPEVFTEVAGSGKNFTADLVRYKIRHIYGIAAVDHRGMYGAIVS